MNEPRIYTIESGYTAGFVDGPHTDHKNPNVMVVHKDDYDALKNTNDQLQARLVALEIEIGQMRGAISILFMDIPREARLKAREFLQQLIDRERHDN